MEAFTTVMDMEEIITPSTLPAGNVLRVLEATQGIVWLSYMWFPY